MCSLALVCGRFDSKHLEEEEKRDTVLSQGRGENVSRRHRVRGGSKQGRDQAAPGPFEPGRSGFVRDRTARARASRTSLLSHGQGRVALSQFIQSVRSRRNSESGRLVWTASGEHSVEKTS